MNKKLIFLVVALSFLVTTTFGQTIQNSVVASSGGSVTSGSVKMDFTLGETVVETFSAGGQTLTQGFHQTNLTLVAIENMDYFTEVNIYPNPTSELVNVDIPANVLGLDISMYDVSGKLINTKTNASGLITFDMKNFATGTYYLQLISVDENRIKTYKLIKN